MAHPLVSFLTSGSFSRCLACCCRTRAVCAKLERLFGELVSEKGIHAKVRVKNGATHPPERIIATSGICVEWYTRLSNGSKQASGSHLVFVWMIEHMFFIWIRLTFCP